MEKVQPLVWCFEVSACRAQFRDIKLGITNCDNKINIKNLRSQPLQKLYICQMSKKEIAIPEEIIANKIFLVRDKKVMLDSDLAELYQVETKRLNEQVKRNTGRFPEDFMFQLTKEEWADLKSQNATSSWGGRRNEPYVFTEHGVLMLSSVLNSERAIAVNIKIMRVYTKIKEMLLTHKDLLLKMEEIEKKLSSHNKNIELVFNYLDELIDKKNNEKPRKQIGYKADSPDGSGLE